MLNVKQNKLLFYRKYIAGSVGECVDLVQKLRLAFDYDENLVADPIMWFRGHSFSNYVLEPTLYRSIYGTFCSAGACKGKSCSSLSGVCNIKNASYGLPKMQEDMRYQNYRAKNIGLSERGGEFSKIDWLGHMQHHGMKTRLLDWTESLIHSLIFAIEPLLDPNAAPEKVNMLSPHIWVLFPQMLNAKVLSELHGESRDINKYADKWLTRYEKISRTEKDKLKSRIYESLEKEDCLFKTNGRTAADSMNLIFNLRVIEKEIENLEYKGILRKAVMNGSYIPALFPLINEFYVEGRMVEASCNLPPFAFTQERQSKRIASQKGVFTIFPFYQYDPRKSGKKVHPAMENMSCCRDVLFKIELYDCEKIAWQLKAMGVTRDWLYPEDPVISETIEGG